jgi:hypothetical protein
MSDFLEQHGFDIEKIREENIQSQRTDYTQILEVCEMLYKWKTGRYVFNDKKELQRAFSILALARNEWRQNLRPTEKEYDASVYNLVNATLKLVSKK